MKFLSILVQVKVNAAILNSCLVYENVIEVVSQPFYTNNTQRWYLVIDDVLPTNLTLNDICSYDVNDVVPYVKQLDELVKLFLNEVLNIRTQLVTNVLVKVQSDKLTSRGNSQEVRSNFVDAPIAFWEFRNSTILIQPLCLVSYKGNVVMVKLVTDISKECC